MSNRSTVLLEHHLKELKLPTFLREYGKVAGQCAAEGVDHPGYLLRLAELELIDRHHRMGDRRIKEIYRGANTKDADVERAVEVARGENNRGLFVGHVSSHAFRIQKTGGVHY